MPPRVWRSRNARRILRPQQVRVITRTPDTPRVKASDRNRIQYSNSPQGRISFMSIRLRQICLVANQLAPVIEDFKDILGLQVCFIDKGVEVFGLENSLMP